MKRTQMQGPGWIVDYSAARARAIRWLGDRYLLARPINESRYRRSSIGMLPAEHSDESVRPGAGS